LVYASYGLAPEILDANTMQEPTSYPEVNRVLIELHDQVRDILNEHLIGLYLYGSLATEGFEPSRSDIDFAVITVDHLSELNIQALESMHTKLMRSGNKWMRKLEGAYVPKAIIRRHDPDHPPVPILNEGKFYLAPLGSDWVIQRYTLREAECALSGPSLKNLIDFVSLSEVKAAIHEVIDHWWEPMLDHPTRLLDPGYQPFAVLSMCRSLYTLKMGDLTSKSKAAQWARITLPDEWSSLIDHALEWGDGDDIESIERTTAFMQYVIGLCRKPRFYRP
jgi:hypothetical protein